MRAIIEVTPENIRKLFAPNVDEVMNEVRRQWGNLFDETPISQMDHFLQCALDVMEQKIVGGCNEAKFR